ncbi:MAG: hypothetical protein WA890_07550 [Micromonospora sp.]
MSGAALIGMSVVLLALTALGPISRQTVALCFAAEFLIVGAAVLHAGLVRSPDSRVADERRQRPESRRDT